MSKVQLVVLSGPDAATTLPSAVYVGAHRLWVDALTHEVPPIDPSANNPSFVLTYDVNDNLVQIDMTIEAVVYRKTLTYTGENLTGVTAWVTV